jgi:osmoprotectant transport system permease protein
MRHLALLLLLASSVCAAQPIRVGAKHFNEGYILSEIIAQLLESNGYPVERNYNLGGTMVCFSALEKGEIDIYPEYTGTISSEILKIKGAVPPQEIGQQLHRRHGLHMSDPYGFNNTYALVVTKQLALKRSLSSISDLAKHGNLRIGLSYEFMEREDGWGNLSKAYGLPQQPAGLEHGLAYQALTQNSIDVTDAYSTDGEITKYDLVLLKDDRGFFPAYEAVSLYHDRLPEKARQLVARLSGRLNESKMQAMNAAVLYRQQDFATVANAFLEQENLAGTHNVEARSVFRDIAWKTVEHIRITMIAIIAAIILSVPLGVVIYWNPRMAGVALYVTGLLQTIPSIALLAVMIPLLGIGTLPAIVALFLYALLPIIRNTVTGLQSVDPVLKKVADGLGMSRMQKLRLVEFPLALPLVLSGIRIAAVISIGTATLAAFIGAGGLGEFIVTGLALNNTRLILQGALPAAVLALIVELLFELFARLFIPTHLRRR